MPIRQREHKAEQSLQIVDVTEVEQDAVVECLTVRACANSVQHCLGFRVVDGKTFTRANDGHCVADNDISHVHLIALNARIIGALFT